MVKRGNSGEVAIGPSVDPVSCAMPYGGIASTNKAAGWPGLVAGVRCCLASVGDETASQVSSVCFGARRRRGFAEVEVGTVVLPASRKREKCSSDCREANDRVCCRSGTFLP